ncbi:MAG TPA: hypothetical protein VFL83_22565 [Anaeromyxobacter sp.]|nr:hypothetical protein [Anaeromyxobacter sp.]
MMNRVEFLIDATGERIGCLLNPATVVMRRTAGLRPRKSAGLTVTGAGLADDPLLFTGGGVTELLLDLLFDVSIGGSTIRSEDVRDLTGPLWRLAENAEVVEGYGRPPLVRFFWGSAWNFPAVVAAVAERFEDFSESGVPRRSWLRMRLVRVAAPKESASAMAVPLAAALSGAAEPAGPATPPEQEPVEVELHEVEGAGDGAAGEGTAVPQYLGRLADEATGDAREWRRIADENGIEDPLAIPAGAVLRIPRSRP